MMDALSSSTATTNNMIHLNSTCISTVSFDPSTGNLDVTFRSSGRTYTHYRVPAALYHGLITASSAGAFYNENLRGRYGP